MTTLTLNERRRLIRLVLDRTGRSVMSRVRYSPLVRWNFGAPVTDELLLVPQELRTADASFADEVRLGLFGLDGTVATLGQGSVFDISTPNDAWAKGLHGFGWLRHLAAADTPHATEFATTVVGEWIARHGRRRGIAWLPEVVGRRVFSWLANTNLIMKDADPAFYDRFADSLGDQIIHLSAHWRDAPGGLPRLVALIGLMTGAMCTAGHERLAERMVSELVAELRHQIHADGGHVSRNPRTVVELLLDLLPLQTCFKAREHALPAEIEETVERMLRFVQYMRLGDGSLGRFNGMAATPFDALATLVAYVADDVEPLMTADPSGYARLAQGGAIVLVDAGSPPDIEFAAAACAGCLSFEISVNQIPIFVNGGAPGPADQDWLSQSRATASHNTLVLGAKSSSKIIRQRTLEKLIGGAPIRQPDDVSFEVFNDNDAIAIDCRHNGYHKQFGLEHKRRMRLDKGGQWLEGRDQISSPKQQVRLPRDVPFSIHFHLHPDVRCNGHVSPETIRIKLPDQSNWIFSADDATVSIEDSVYYADRVGPTKSQQIVLRGTCFGDKTIDWRLEVDD